MAQQYRLSGGTLEAVTRRACELYGPTARIVSAERVLDQGLGGFLGRRHVEAMVLVPDHAEAPPSFTPHTLPAARGGIAALLDEAERVEDEFQDEPPEATHAPPSVSTQSEIFDVVLARLREDTAADDEPVPALLGEPGDLVLVLGPRPAAYDAARSMADSASRWELAAVGPGAGADWPALAGARGANAARARAVEDGRAVLAVAALDPLEPIEPQLRAAYALHADQVWLAVDARHKPDETADWVDAVAELLPVDALAVVGARETRTAYTVNGLGIPIGWVDGHAAPRTVL
ncbi:hypothetical protein SPF06_08525 [Sinomonas sp. JGH33]|uniref:UspA domain-containing protein n=1 Tax=Sinomonas terricola TaxID=3110330 RepID=A0ABU5T524_9MICC|nr:hypothetical protein [Sinomonas sp. JGH33]MEA5454764.1 hypothetical protein [Sinomonas sp. JGH33]